MGQITTGLRAILNNPRVYDCLQIIMGAKKGRISFCKDYIRPFPGMRILDIGCGTARILDALPDSIEYFGFDASPKYIDQAKRRYGNRGRFECKFVEGFMLAQMPPFDVVLAHGVLHHLGDREAISLIELAHMALKPKGRLITLDGCYIPQQNFIARYLISKDRGQNVRTPDEYTRLAEKVFPVLTATIGHKKWPPYTYFMLECCKSPVD